MTEHSCYYRQVLIERSEAVEKFSGWHAFSTQAGLKTTPEE